MSQLNWIALKAWKNFIFVLNAIVLMKSNLIFCSISWSSQLTEAMRLMWKVNLKEKKTGSHVNGGSETDAPFLMFLKSLIWLQLFFSKFFFITFNSSPFHEVLLQVSWKVTVGLQSRTFRISYFWFKSEFV